MPKDLIIKSEDLAVTLIAMGEILKADRNNQGGCGFLSAGSGVVHLLLQNVDSAKYILESNKLPVSEERNVLVIIADVGDKTSLDLNGVTKAAENFYIIKVPENGSVEITTHIQAGDANTQDTQGTQDTRGCSHIIFDILHSLGLTK